MSDRVATIKRSVSLVVSRMVLVIPLMILLLAGCSNTQPVASPHATKGLTQEEIEEKREQLRTSDFGQARTVAEGVLENLKNQFFAALHSGASKAFQSRFSLEKLQTLGVEISPHLMYHREFRETGESEMGKTHTTLSFSTDLGFDQVRKRLTLFLIKSELVWQLDEFKWEPVAP